MCGVLISCESPLATSAYDKWKLYRATSRTGTYSVINGSTGQLLTDLTYYDTTGTSSHWYKITYYTASTGDESTLSNPFKGLSNTYTSVKKVEQFLQLSNSFSDTTPMVVATVTRIILQKEDYIDDLTGHAWRERFSRSSSGVDIESLEYEYPKIYRTYMGGAGYRFDLSHRSVKQLDSTQGDVFEIWNGTTWEDWLGGKTEGRGDDYWVDYSQGVVYIRNYQWMINYEKPIRIKYRYGEDRVSLAIEDICTKLVAIELLSNEDRGYKLPEGVQGYGYDSRINKWERDVEKVLEKKKEFTLIHS